MTPTARRAAEALANVDPARMRGEFAVGLRDGALLALIAGGVTCTEASRLKCNQILIEAKSRLVVVRVRRGRWLSRLMLPLDLSAYVVAWLTEIRGFGEDRPFLVDSRGEASRGLQRVGVSAIVSRYHGRGRAAA